LIAAGVDHLAVFPPWKDKGKTDEVMSYRLRSSTVVAGTNLICVKRQRVLWCGIIFVLLNILLVI
jgi:hypothetical protein